MRKHKLDKQFGKFLEVFKKLHINIPFVDALAQMPSYVKFMKEILSNKRKLEEHETVMLTDESSAIIQKKTTTETKKNYHRNLKIQGVLLFLVPLVVYSLNKLYVIWVLVSI